MKTTTSSVRSFFVIIVTATLSIVSFQASVHANQINSVNNVDEIYVSDNKLERVKVKWVKPSSFTDVRQSNSSNDKFRKHVFSQLEKHLDKLAKDLPQGQSLTLSVTDVDLAGRVEPAFFTGLSHRMDDVRIMRDIDIPRLKFAYELVDADGNILKSDEVTLKNMNYLQSAGMSNRNRPFAHEKKMLSKWYAQNIEDADV